jgi:hypothetical protein
MVLKDILDYYTYYLIEKGRCESGFWEVCSKEEFLWNWHLVSWCAFSSFTFSHNRTDDDDDDDARDLHLSVWRSHVAFCEQWVPIYLPSSNEYGSAWKMPWSLWPILQSGQDLVGILWSPWRENEGWALRHHNLQTRPIRPTAQSTDGIPFPASIV